jgi:hypothetical protein
MRAAAGNPRGGEIPMELLQKPFCLKKEFIKGGD